MIVLTTNAERIGGIERVSRTLIRSLADLNGADRVGLLSVWAQSTDQPCVILTAVGHETADGWGSEPGSLSSPGRSRAL